MIAPPRARLHVSRAPPEGLDWSSTREGFLRRAIGRPPQAFEPAPNKQGGPASQPEPPTCVGREGLRARPSAKDAPPLWPSAMAYIPKNVGLRAFRSAGHGCHSVRASIRTCPHRVAPGWSIAQPRASWRAACGWGFAGDAALLAAALPRGPRCGRHGCFKGCAPEGEGDDEASSDG